MTPICRLLKRALRSGNPVLSSQYCSHTASLPFHEPHTTTTLASENIPTRSPSMSALGGIPAAVSEFLIGPFYYDERTSDWPLVDWKPAMAITALYILGVRAGQRLMRSRKPFNMKLFSMLHNTVMFILSLYMVVETIIQAADSIGWTRGEGAFWGNRAEAPGKPFTPAGYRLARVLWIHYLSKVYEFMDTAIMILKKNDRQISFLHVYHHASTFYPTWWAGMNFAPGGDAALICALNSLIHVFMYGYYLLAAAGIKVPKSIKKSMTSMQLAQFGFFFAHAIYLLFISTDYRPRITPVICLWQATVFASLFGQFYWQTYVRPIKHAGVESKTA